MDKTLIFGTGSTGRRIYEEIKNSTQIVGFLDNDSAKWGVKIEGIPIIGNGEAVKDIEYDEIVVCSLPGMKAIQKQLLEMGIPANKINCEHIYTQVNARLNFLQDFSGLYANLPETIAIAEGGVFKEILPRRLIAVFQTIGCSCLIRLRDSMREIYIKSMKKDFRYSKKAI